jgi:hypothetical protein
MSASELAASGREARTARRTGPADADSSARSALRRPLLELATARVERAVYSRRQLQEVLVDFWMNHFQRLCRKGRRPVPVASAWLDAGALECRVAVARAIARRAALPEPADAILEKLFPAGSSADLNAVFPQAAAGSGARQALALALSSPVDAGRLAEPGPPARPARARSRLSSGGPEQPPAPDPEGTESAIAISDLDDLTGSADVDPLESEVVALYDRQTDAVLGRAGRELGRAGALLCATRLDAAAPAAVYPRGRLAESLRQIARLIKSDVGLEVAFADVGGWDTHVNQGASEGQLARPPLFGQPSPPLDHRGPRTLSWTLVPAPPWRPPRRRPPAPTDPP